ncbi:hypothetical protein M758_9G083100 [Ceratodon purpureus]|nr:hypothetical protein M758_9G083100 [Ceratodon purpureus]
MDWPPRAGPLGPDPYPRPGAAGSLHSPESTREHGDYQTYLPPTNPPWALRSQHYGAADAGTPYPNEQVPVYPPRSNRVDHPRSEHYPPELPPQSSTAESYTDLWIHQNSSSGFDPKPYPEWELQHKHAGSGGIAFGGASPASHPYPYLHSTGSYPPSSFSGDIPNSFASPYAFPASTTPSAPPPPLEFPPACAPGSNGAQSWCAPEVWPSAPNLAGGPGLSFGCKPTSAHPLLQSVEDDFVPYEVNGNEQSDVGEEVEASYDENFDYSHEALEKYGMNLTTRAQEGSLGPVIGRDLVVRQCIEILTRKSKCNPVLVGHPGVGKTAVVEGLAQRIVKGDVPEPLRKCKIISVDFQNVTADTKYSGQFEEKMKELLDEATKAKRKVILFLDELHRVIGAGKTENKVDTASEALKPALARGDFLCIGATTFDEYSKYVEQDQALSRRFQKVIVDPPSPEDAISILRGLKPSLESHHGISIADDALVEAVKLSERYIPDSFLPDKAIDLVDVAASKLKIGLISKPLILDEIDRAILELDMERLSVTAASGQSSQDRLRQILSDLDGLKLRQTNLNRKWKKEKALVTRIVSLKEKMTAVKTGTGSDANENDGAHEVHSYVTCDACHVCPIIGRRYTQKDEDVDLCTACYEVVLKGSEQLSSKLFYRVEPPRLTCDGCWVDPITTPSYYENNQDRDNTLCQPCWRKVMRSQPSDSLNFYFEIHNNFEGSQPKRSNDSTVTTRLKDLEAQLETAEKEWREYQNSYKPLIQLEVTSIVIAEVLSSKTGIPVARMQASQMQLLLQLDVELHKRVIGQDEGCNAIARAIQRSRAGLSDPKRPIASLMFMGPTGVGKTELAKALATHLFNSENAMVRIDMSEYGDKSSISRLTGAAPGLVGYGDGGQLTTPVRRQPYSVVLFDEIEKADDDIFNIFLQILDDGRLTDSASRVVNFTNTVIIMTSNVGAESILEVSANPNAYTSKDEAYQAMKSKVMEAARAKYRPEFINRIDEFVVFQPLNPQQISEIVKLQLEGVSKRLLERLIKLRVSESAIQLLSTMGYDPRYGARPVKRVIQKSIEDPLAQGILRGQFTEGCTVMVDIEFTSVVPSQQPQQRLTFHKLLAA